MVPTIKPLITYLLIIIGFYINGQTYDGMKGNGVYKKYDKSFVTPHLRAKHSISLAPILSFNSPFTSDVEPSFGAHIGYNYLIFKRRKKKKLNKKKVKYKDEVKMGFGLHLGLLTQDEKLIMGKFYYPTIPIRGKALSWYLFSEIGIGAHKLSTFNGSSRPWKFNASLEIFRLRFGKSPLHIHLTGNYAVWSNNLFIKEPINLGLIGGLRYYFYKKHKE